VNRVGQVAVVTGAASGIGRAIAVRLLAQGARVVLADRDEAGLTTVMAGLDPAGRDRAEAAPLDVTDAAAVRTAFAAAAAAHGRLDLVFNNAGIAVAGSTQALSLEHWNAAIDVNLRGVVHGVSAAYPIMLRAGRGHIVNTASLAGLAIPPRMIPYVTTKWAVVGLSLALRVEAARHGVRVSVLCPGFVDTPMLTNVNPGLAPLDAAEPARRVATGGRALDVDRLAGDALRGVARNRALIVTPASARLVWRLGRFAPPAVTVALTRLVAR
jgi:NAD(P)-dependent dehydrogenase (short-subunit alcohol dehydrogenase family)